MPDTDILTIDYGNKYDAPGTNELYNMCSLTDPRENEDLLLSKLSNEVSYATSIACNMQCYSSDNEYDKLMGKIIEDGTISPSGPIEKTPAAIKLQLKPHQQRTLYEMIRREDSEYRLVGNNNILMLYICAI